MLGGCDLTTHIEYLEERIQATEKEIEELINQTPDLKFTRKTLDVYSRHCDI